MQEITAKNWPRLDPITKRKLCDPCWNGIHFIVKKTWSKKQQKFVKTKLSACCGCECLCRQMLREQYKKPRASASQRFLLEAA